MMRRVLLFEYLHANSQWYADATPSMRNEGRAMLLAAAADLAALDDVSVCVAICEAAHNLLPAMQGVDFVCVDSVHEADFAVSVLKHDQFSDVLPIAPEIGGVLAKLVQEFRSRGQRVIAASENTMQLGTNKWQMFQFLQQHQIATISTSLVADHTDADFPETCVIKPIDGAGCEGIRRMARVEFDNFKTQSSVDESVIVQPFVAGQSYSVGLIGQGANTSPLILPIATQHVEWINDTPQYRGGSIPALLSPDRQDSLQELLDQVANCIAVDSGYVGIDLLRSTGQKDAKWLITEINPRLCTSYIGYRKATRSNLARYLLGKCCDPPPKWNLTPVVFSCESVDLAGYNP